MSVRLTLYRALVRSLGGRFFSRRSGLRHFELLGSEEVFEQGKGTFVWFHAASAGELESLAPVALEYSRRGGRIVLSVFSESGVLQLTRLAQRIETVAGTRPLCFFSPPEGKWGNALEKLRPSLFVTVKYEAWPDLWASLALHSVPLVILTARQRSSLKGVKRVLKLLGVSLPKLWLLTVRPVEVAPLRKLFACAEVDSVGDPRWDQVQSRARSGSPRAEELLRSSIEMPRPWGMLAQVWPEDISAWRTSLSKFSGTLWVVPHRIEDEVIQFAEQELRTAGFQIKRTLAPIPNALSQWPRLESAQLTKSETCSQAKQALIVNEMGVLVELYSAMDWCYIGGGFGEGVHSTIEPAMQGLPILAGPGGAQKFSEIQILRESGQLELARSPREIVRWLDQIPTLDSGLRGRWKLEAEGRLGASVRVVDIIEKLLKGSFVSPPSSC